MTPVFPALVAMLAVQMIVSMAVATGPVLAPLATADFGIESHHVGTFISLTYVLAASVGLVSGGLIARFGAFRMTQACLVLAGLGLLVGALASPVMALLAAVVIGSGSGPTTPSSSQILARLTPPQWMNAVFSARQMGVPLGGAIAGLMMPALAVLFGWRVAVVTGAVLCLVLALAIEPWRKQMDSGRDRERRLFSLSQLSHPLRIVFATAELRRMMIVGFIYSGIQTTFSAFLITYLHDRLDMTLVQAGFMLTVALTSGAVGRIVWGTVADRFITPRLMLGLLGLGMSVCSLATAGFAPDWPYALIVTVCMAFGATTIAWNGVFLAQIVQLAPPGGVADTTGGATFFLFGGVVALPGMFTVLLALTGSYAIGFTAAAVLTLTAGLWMLRPASAVPPTIP
jgi:MFS family permease